MKEGMLWYDDDKQRTLEDKVQRAADYFQEKYGQKPNLCLINANMDVNGVNDALGTIELRTAKNVLPNHFWVGILEKEEQESLELVD
ncbi:MAG: hypothetical protein JXA42_21085 [Anaerolineales bacterium]|nr:hypothetical protein [Anaerolineales bacterium]